MSGLVRAWLGVAALSCGIEAARVDAPTIPIAKQEPIATPEPVAKLEPIAKALEPPPGLVDLRAVIPSIRLSIGYATTANFTGAPLPGYTAAAAWAHPDLAKTLADVDAVLATENLGLLVYDAYRPKRATEAMVEWTRKNGRTDLLRDGYIAERSQHNRGLAIDLTLVARTSGAPVDMGGEWDAFERSSAAFAAKGEALANRRKLRVAMTKEGFVPHDGEWWHFSLPHPNAPVLDVPY